MSVMAPSEQSAAASAPPATRQIFLVDDNDAFRSSTRWLLEGHGFQVDAFASPSHFLAYVAALPEPAALSACILLDIRMPEMSGLEVQTQLRQRACPFPVVFISGHGDVPLAVEAMRRGAAHFLEKPFSPEALVAVLNDALQRAATDRTQPIESDTLARERIATLTTRERQVLDFAVEGMLNKTIADKLGISIKTVELHRSRVMAKTKARSIAQLVQLTMRARGR
jgi:two-component system, LuxR family, response regulator FixJ